MRYIAPKVAAPAIEILKTGTKLIVAEDGVGRDFVSINSKKLAEVSLTGQDFESWSDSSRHYFEIKRKDGLTAVKTGVATHIAFFSNNDLLYVTQCPARQVQQGDTINIPKIGINFAFPQ